MRMRMIVVVGVALGLVGISPLRARAAPQRPLPPFTVVRIAGAVASANLPVPDQWLLMYVATDCRSCDLLLAALKDWQSPRLLERTVIIVGGDLVGAQAYVGRTVPPEVASIPWFADPQSQAWNALNLKGTPMLIGVRQGQIQWAISGVLNDPNALASVVKTWVSQ
jgi:hypothetical protein